MKNRGLLLALSPKDGGESEEKVLDSGEEDSALDAMFDAIEEGDRKGAKLAFKAAVQACMSEYPEAE